MLTWKDCLWGKGDLKGRLQNIIYVSTYTHFTYAWTMSRRLHTSEDFPPTLSYPILLDFLFMTSMDYFHVFHFRTNKSILSLTQAGKVMLKRRSSLPSWTISLARTCPSPQSEISCWAGAGSSWMPLNADHARMKIQNLKREDPLCNYIKPYLQYV